MIYGNREAQQTVWRMLFMFGIMAVVWFCLLSRGWSQEPATSPTPTLAPPHDAVCEVSNMLGVGAESPSGSGTYIRKVGDRGYVLTCDHVWHQRICNGKSCRWGRKVGKGLLRNFQLDQFHAPSIVTTVRR